eukprot:c23966_g1_i1 orf=670-1368(-)
MLKLLLDGHFKGALLSHLLLEPIYLKSITVALEMEECCLECREGSAVVLDDGNSRFHQRRGFLGTSHSNKKQHFMALKRALYERLLPTASMLSAPYKVNLPSFWIGPSAPKEFQKCFDGMTFIACGFSIAWNATGFHEVILGTTGRKQGTSVKGNLSPATQSSLCRKAIQKLFVSIFSLFQNCEQLKMMSYFGMKRAAEAYFKARDAFYKNCFFKDWLLKPPSLQCFQISSD